MRKKLRIWPRDYFPVNFLHSFSGWPCLVAICKSPGRSCAVQEPGPDEGDSQKNQIWDKRRTSDSRTDRGRGTAPTISICTNVLALIIFVLGWFERVRPGGVYLEQSDVNELLRSRRSLHETLTELRVLQHHLLLFLKHQLHRNKGRWHGTGSSKALEIKVPDSGS